MTLNIFAALTFVVTPTVLAFVVAATADVELAVIAGTLAFAAVAATPALFVAGTAAVSAQCAVADLPARTAAAESSGIVRACAANDFKLKF